MTINNQNTDIDEIVLGFDARDVSDGQKRSAWSEARREKWLFRPDVVQPLSVDSNVWPSVTFYQQHLGERAWIGFIQDLWDDLDKLLEFLKSHPPPKTYEVVAVSLMQDGLSSAERHLWNDVILPTSPSKVSSTWRPLGCDVADRFLTSGLMSCIPGTHPEFSRIKTVFEPKLNINHLFNSLRDANDFREEFNKVVIDHAPFFVFRLYTMNGRAS